MEHRGIEFTVVQTANPTGWKWTVHFPGHLSKTGMSSSRARARPKPQSTKGNQRVLRSKSSPRSAIAQHISEILPRRGYVLRGTQLALHERSKSLVLAASVISKPKTRVGLRIVFSRIAQRSLALRPAHSRCHLFVTR